MIEKTKNYFFGDINIQRKFVELKEKVMKPFIKMVTNSIKKASIRKAIIGIAKEYQKYPDIILNEDDLQARLFVELCKNKYFSEIKKTMKVKGEPSYYTNRLHLEVPFYEGGKLRGRPDLIVADPENIDLSKKTAKMNARRHQKTYYIIKAEFVFYLKNRRGGYRKGLKSDIQKDLKKIGNFHGKNIYFYLICFDKKEFFDKEGIISIIMDFIKNHSHSDITGTIMVYVTPKGNFFINVNKRFLSKLKSDKQSV